MWSQVGLREASLRTKFGEVMEFQLCYFKSWKMMLWKCCTQYTSEFGKLSSGHMTGKGPFSFQSQRKTMPKISHATPQLASPSTATATTRENPVCCSEDPKCHKWDITEPKITFKNKWIFLRNCYKINLGEKNLRFIFLKNQLSIKRELVREKEKQPFNLSPVYKTMEKWKMLKNKLRNYKFLVFQSASKIFNVLVGRQKRRLTNHDLP